MDKTRNLLTKNQLLVAVIFGLISKTQSQTCSSPQIPEFDIGYDNENDLSLSYNGVILTLNMEGTDQIQSTESTQGWNKKYIDASLSNSDLVIYTTDDFKDYAKEQSNDQIFLLINFLCSNRETKSLLFRQNILRSNEYEPVFSKSLYEVIVPLPLYKGFDLTIFESISATDYDIFDNQVTFSSNDSELITVGTSDKVSNGGKTFYATLILSQPLQSIIDRIEFSITATDKGTPARSSVAKVTIAADQTNSAIPAPDFEKILYDGHLNNNHLELDEIVLDSKTYSESVTFTKEGRDKDLFTFLQNLNRLKVKLDKKITDDDLKDKTLLVFEIIATNDAKMSGRTAIAISFPLSNDSETTCTPCSEVTTPTPDDIPEFTTKFYEFTVDPQFLGVLATVKATIAWSSVEPKYSIVFYDDHLQSRIFIGEKSGEIRVTDPIIPGNYFFDLMALNEETEGVGKATAKLHVSAINVCPDGSTVSKSLFIKHIDEQTESDVFSSRESECEFVVFSMIPSEREYVKINRTTETVTTIAINREDEIFSNMIVPQVQVTLKLICDQRKLPNYRFIPSNISLVNANEKTSRTPSQIGTRSVVLTENIDYATDITMLTLIIEDINDNSPQFTYPSSANPIIGYPETKVAEILLPNYLIKVEATDNDDGLNAKIRFKIDRNVHFEINPESGEIFPFSNAMLNVDETMLIVYATDRDGAENGNSVSINLKVKKLRSKHMTLLTIKNKRAEDLKDILDSIRQETGIDLIVLKHAVIPISETSFSGSISERVKRSFESFLRQADQTTVLKAWVYAFDDDQEPIGNEEIHEKISDVSEQTGVTAEPYVEEKENTLQTASDKGLVVAICLLTVVIIVILIGTFLFWWFLVRPYNYDNIVRNLREGRTSWENSVDDDMDYSVENADGKSAQKKSKQHYQQRNSLAVIGNTQHESNDDPYHTENDYEQHDNNNYSENKDTFPYPNGNIGSDNKKSTVTFNEMVERIDIEVDDAGSSNKNDIRL